MNISRDQSCRGDRRRRRLSVLVLLTIVILCLSDYAAFGGDSLTTPGILVNGRHFEQHAPIPTGSWIALTAGGFESGCRLTLTELQTGSVLYEGNADDLRFSFIAIRPQAYELEAAFSSPRKTVRLQLKPTAGSVLYPGLEYRIIRMNAADDVVPSASRFEVPNDAIGTDPRTTDEQVYAVYPEYRTAESVRDLDIEKPSFQLPSYWHGATAEPILPGPLPPADIAASVYTDWKIPLDEPVVRKGQTLTHATVKAPMPRFRTAMAFRGKLRVDQGGLHRFRIRTGFPLRVTVGGHTKTFDDLVRPGDIKTLEFSTNLPEGLVDWDLSFSNRSGEWMEELLREKYEAQQKVAAHERAVGNIRRFTALIEGGQAQVEAARKKGATPKQVSLLQRRLDLARRGLPGAQEAVLGEEELTQTRQLAARRQSQALVVDWMRPGEDVFRELGADKFYHEVDRRREAAYQQFTKQTPWRNRFPLRVDATHPVMKEFAESCRIGDFGEGSQLSTALLAWATGPTPETFDALIPALEAEIETSFPNGYKIRKDERADPKLLRKAIGLRGVLERGLRSLKHQGAFFAIRARLHACTIHYGRPYMIEYQKGTNDGAYRESGFLKTMWLVAQAMDDPLAWDASRSHYDNHFRYSGSSDVGYEGREGMQFDGGYAFHSTNGRQLSQGGYGKHWCSAVINAAHLGTPWGHTREQYRRLVDYQLKDEWLHHRANRSFYRSGRYANFHDQPDTKFLNRLMRLPDRALDQRDREHVRQILERRIGGIGQTGNYFFHKFLLMRHQRPDYGIETKMSSPIVGAMETFNGRQPANLFMADGVTFLFRRGTEYDGLTKASNYLPGSVFIFTALPGTTQLNYFWGANGKDELGKYRKYGGTHSGGVSDGRFGNCSFDFVSCQETATTAKKFYAFTEDGMAVLSTDIDGGRPAPPHYSYRSNLNQCRFTHSISIVSEDGESTTIAAGDVERFVELPLDQRYWIEHAGIGYLVLPTGQERGESQPGTLCLRTSIRTAVNRLRKEVWDKRTSDKYYEECLAKVAENSVPTLDIWIDHGPQPTNADSAYYVCMRPEECDPRQLLREPPIQILSNTADVMALQDNADGVTHAFFRKPTVLTADGEKLVEVDKPCALMLVPGESNTMHVYVQDAKTSATYDIAEMADDIRLTLHRNGRRQTMGFEMSGKGTPDARYRGATAHNQLRFHDE